MSINLTEKQLHGDLANEVSLLGILWHVSPTMSHISPYVIDGNAACNLRTQSKCGANQNEIDLLETSACYEISLMHTAMVCSVANKRSQNKITATKHAAMLAMERDQLRAL